MMKWYEVPESAETNVIYSKVRLVRNWSEYPFPGKMTKEQSLEMTARILSSMQGLNELDQNNYSFSYLHQMTDLEKAVLMERKVLNQGILKKKDAGGLVLSEDESTGVTINGDDHIRIQVLEKGLSLADCFQRANQIDDHIGEHVDYAYDEKYGYLTAFPTNMGTGLRASVIVHLPMLSRRKNFNSLVADMGRFGMTIRGVYGEGSENYGSLYRVSNQKTLGQTEKDIIDLVSKAATELSLQERRLRREALKHHAVACADEAYKSYGVLKYARRLSKKEAMEYLSQLMSGISSGILDVTDPCSIHELILGAQTANLLSHADRPLNKEEVDEARADYLRAHLPEIR
ncbi:MAG: ATP--guanido phosphotransferase [Lachnospiraceae bacterium]|nr:ATP--guanido phosphotransferase [Lachnospiraceae bacterium]